MNIQQYNGKEKKVKSKHSLGFTLIELLIVIALLGVLAVALLATIDPFEQFKKGTDTARRNITSEVYNAVIRTYATKGDFPWQIDVVAMALNEPAMTDAGTGYLSQVINAGELKPEFIDLAGDGNLGKILITSVADANGVRQNISVCFLPESKSFLSEGNAKYADDGSAGTECKSVGGANSCYWCIK